MQYGSVSYDSVSRMLIRQTKALQSGAKAATPIIKSVACNRIVLL